MATASQHPTELPHEPNWDVTFTRLAQLAQPLIKILGLDLARRFNSLGLSSNWQVRPTPRGVSHFLALVGQRALICIVDMTLVDGMTVGEGHRAKLDIRLLDACGEVVAGGLGSELQARSFHDGLSAQAVISGNLKQTAATVYVAALGHFELLRA
jgi:hypothetical protein